MIARAPDTSAEAAIRDAVAFGQAKAVRELLDALHEARRRAERPLHGGTVVYSDGSKFPDDTQRALWTGKGDGLDEAIRIVKAYRISDGGEG